jgi:hypothetical protein
MILRDSPERSVGRGGMWDYFAVSCEGKNSFSEKSTEKMKILLLFI